MSFCCHDSFWLKQHHLIHRIQACILPLRPVHHVSLTSCISLTSCNQLLKRNWLNPVFNSNFETWITSSDPSVQWIAYSHVFCLWDIRGHNSKGPPWTFGLAHVCSETSTTSCNQQFGWIDWIWYSILIRLKCPNLIHLYHWFLRGLTFTLRPLQPHLISPSD